MHITILLIGATLLCSILNAQRHDNAWVLGYTGFDVEYGHSLLTFDDGRLKIDTIPNPIAQSYSFLHNNASIAHSDGSLFAFFNGIHIQNSQYQTMQNGQSLNEEVEKYNYYMSDELIPQGSVFIPYPGKPDSALLLYASERYLLANNGSISQICSADISGAIISGLSGNGLEKVSERQHRIIENDTLLNGVVMVCRHANGRDWWLLAFKQNTNKYHRVLIKPSGFYPQEMGVVTLPVIRGANAACFSPDGTKFAVYNTISQVVGSYLNIFDFDRCTGMLSNQIQIQDTRGYGGLAFSPNSRFLYHNKETVAHQYDLWATDIPASRKVIAVYDGFQAPFPTTFYMLRLAPDGKIYGSATNGTQYLHVIHNPDEAGTDCQYQQHGIQLLKYNGFSLPNFPNYRLGPLDGSPCDTLGLNNHPKAWYRYEQDTLDALAVEFRDLSYYEPATWAWDFGDGSPTSSTRHPQHQYAQPGAYQVCLTVSNQYGTDTHCKTLFLGVTGLDDPVLLTPEQVQVRPNPASDRVRLSLPSGTDGPVQVQLFDLAGRLAFETTGTPSNGILDLNLATLKTGLYVCRASTAGRRFAPVKLSIIR